MNKLHIKGLVTKSENKYQIVASTNCIDRQGDVIDQKGWLIENYMKNPVMLFGHNYNSLPVAKCTSLEITADSMIAGFEFAPAEGNPVGAQIKWLYDNGYMSAVSVGFIPKEQQGNVITKAELLEISFVPVPANQEALKLTYKSIDGNTELSDEDKTHLKSVIVLEEKGEVTDEVNAEEMCEQKYEKIGGVSDILSAFWKVYMSEETPVEDFAKLLNETIALLQIVADENGVNTDEMKGLQGSVANSISKENTVKHYEVMLSRKAGREISAANHTKLKAAHESATQCLAVIGEMIASAEVGDGKAVDTIKVGEVVEEKKSDTVEVKADDMLNTRQNLVAAGKNFELAMKAINMFLAAGKK